MKKILIAAITLFSTVSVFSQGIQVGLEGNYGMWQQYGNVNVTLNKNKWFVKPSLKYGNFGKSDSISITENPYIQAEMNENSNDPNYIYYTSAYSSVNRGVSPEIKIGYMFGKEEKRSSLSVALSFAYYWIADDFKRIDYLKQINTGETKKVIVSSKEKIKHQNYSVGLSLDYGYKINEKLRLTVGLNLPYYQPIVTNHYNPNRFDGVFDKPLMLNSLNPNFSIGLNYKIK